MLHNKLKNIPLSNLYRKSLELGNNDPKFIALGMSGALLSELYGREWMGTRLLTEKNLSFLTADSPNSLNELKLQNRILTIAEGLYNLSKIAGFQNVLERLKNDANVDSVIAEIESGRFLLHRGLSFKYVTRSLKKRADFDIHIIDGSNELFCEIKCKIETTAFSTASFANSLHKAKQQLPLNWPAIILIKIPDNWAEHEGELRSTAQVIVEKAERPVGVVCWFEQWIQVDETYTMRVIIGFEEHNLRSRILNSKLIPFLPAKPQTPNWMSFERYVAGYI
jgi:hypothetical protein